MLLISQINSKIVVFAKQKKKKKRLKSKKECNIKNKIRCYYPKYIQTNSFFVFTAAIIH